MGANSLALPGSGMLWTVDDLAGFLQVRRKSIYRMVEAGVLPYIKLGRRVRFDPAEIRRFLLESTPTTGLSCVSGASVLGNTAQPA